MSRRNDRERALEGKRVLIAEDDFLIALELQTVLEDAGAEVIGPCGSVAAAMRLIDSDDDIAAAILDVRLGSDTAGALATRLDDEAIPFLFYTGQGRGEPFFAAWPGHRIISKPAPASALIEAVSRLVIH